MSCPFQVLSRFLCVRLQLFLRHLCVLLLFKKSVVQGSFQICIMPVFSHVKVKPYMCSVYTIYIYMLRYICIARETHEDSFTEDSRVVFFGG